MSPLLYGPYNRPLPSYGVHRTTGGHSGTLANWMTFRMSRGTEPYERNTIASRAQDLVANDPHAANIAESMGVGVVGTGLWPQSRPNWKLLGWSEEEAETFQTQAE